MGEGTKVVLDTNVYVSAFGWGGKPDDCFQLVIDGEVQNYVSSKLLDEVSTVLEYPKFDFSDDQKARTGRINRLGVECSGTKRERGQTRR